MLVRTLLFVWLFSMAAAWVNACILQERVAFPGHETSNRTGAPWPGPSVATLADAHHAGDETALEACLSFCASEKAVVSKFELPTFPDIDVAMSEPVEAWMAGAPGRASEPVRPRAAPPPPGPAVAIRFLRLTL